MTYTCDGRDQVIISYTSHEWRFGRYLDNTLAGNSPSLPVHLTCTPYLMTGRRCTCADHASPQSSYDSLTWWWCWLIPFLFSPLFPSSPHPLFSTLSPFTLVLYLLNVSSYLVMKLTPASPPHHRLLPSFLPSSHVMKRVSWKHHCETSSRWFVTVYAGTCTYKSFVMLWL